MAVQTLGAINYQSVKGMIRMFDFLYKMGVEHAVLASDKDDIVQFAEEVATPNKFKLFNEKATYNWAGWRSRLYFWSIDLKRGSSFLTEFLRDASVYRSVYGAFYPISFDFYIQGIIDGMENPITADSLELFKATPNIMLKKFIENPLYRKLKEKEYVAMVQHYTYERIQMEAEAEGRPTKIPERFYNRFAQHFWQSLIKHQTMLQGRLIKKRLAKAKLEKVKNKIGERKVRDGFFDKD